VKVTPLDIRRKEFKRSLRGYSDEEVDIFLDEVADDFERLFQENIELHDRLQRLEEQIAGHAQIKDALEKTLVSAQLQSDELRANARKESELILRDAEFKAREIVNDSYGETQRVQQALIQLKHLEEDFRFKFRSLLEGHLKLLNDAPITVAGTETIALEKASVPEDEVPLVVPEALVPTPEASESAPEDAAGVVAAAPPRSYDDIPTEESFIEMSDGSGAGAGSAGRPAGEVIPEEVTADESSPGFFFGRRLDDVDDVFLNPENGVKRKGRDFEW